MQGYENYWSLFSYPYHTDRTKSDSVSSRRSPDVRESVKCLLVESGMRGILLLESGIREIFGCGNLESEKFELWDPDSWALKSGIQVKESEISVTIAIRIPSFNDKESST